MYTNCSQVHKLRKIKLKHRNIMRDKIKTMPSIVSRKIFLIFIDLVIAASIFVATDLFYIYYTNKPDVVITQKVIFVVILLSLLLLFRLVLSIYSSVWRYANSYAYIRLLIADSITTLAFLLLTRYNSPSYFTGWVKLSLICMISLATFASRFFYQMYHNNNNYKEKKQYGGIKNAAIIGAGVVGVSLANEMKVNYKSNYVPFCFVDIDKSKIGNNISGIPVLEADDRIIEKLKAQPVDEIIIALPKLTAEKKERMFNFYKNTGLPIKIYDFAFGVNDNSNSKRIIRNINIEDLLFRDPINLHIDPETNYYHNKVVLVTGGGGSIGSEICRQLIKYNVRQLIILDIYENNAFEIQQELGREYNNTKNIAVEIASVRDRDRLECVFRQYKPEIVFHAAAHKHVPLMEGSPAEAIKNNVFGTYNAADMAEKYGVEKFILISTDKAVNPTNIMGASKRLCEMIVQSRHDSKTSFSAVRFGNVLGSNGSVIPTFKKQIENGGPVTITDKKVIRYFMTIPEASQLVLQAGIMAKMGELFVLDMGKPVKILDLAENMIRLSGFIPYESIDIKEIGLRPGEKLFEELLIKSEAMTSTENKKIYIEKDTPLSRVIIDGYMDNLIKTLGIYTTTLDHLVIKKALRKIVPTYVDPEVINCKADESEEMKIVFTDSVKLPY